MNSTSQTILAGFENPAQQSQHVFRQVLEAMSHPGKIVTIDGIPAGPHELSPAAVAVCLTLIDYETPLWLDEGSSSAQSYFTFHCGCPVVAKPQAAQFALISNPQALQSFNQFNIGTNEHPELSTTLIIDVERLGSIDGTVLTGPGIKDIATLDISGINGEFWALVKENRELFPRGIDIVLTSGSCVAALPRTVIVEDR